MTQQLRMAASAVVTWARHRSADDTGASVVEVAIVAAGVAVLAIALMGAIAALVNGQLPDISAG